MTVVRVQTDSIEPIQIFATDSTAAGLTGKTDLYVRIRRNSDGFFLDWNDDTFKSSGWTTLNQLLSEVDSTNFPGLYQVTGGWDLSGITNQTADDSYLVLPLQTPGTDAFLPAPGEIKEGQWVDDIVDILTDTADMQPRVAAIEIDTNEIQGKLPDNYIMGSAVTTDKDDDIDAILTDTADMQPRVVAIETDTNEMQGKLPTNNIMGSSVKTDKDDEIDAIKAATDNLPADPASETNVNANETKIDAVQTDVTAILADTNAIDTRLPSDPADESLQQAAHTQTQADIAALNDLAVADVQTAMTNQGYTAARAPNLDNADTTTSSRSAPGDAMDLITDAVDSDALATSAVNELVDEVWDRDITLHTVVDSAGEAQNRLDADITSRSSHTAADVETLNVAAHGAGSHETATGFSTHSVAQVVTGVWSEDLTGYTVTNSAGEKVTAIKDRIG